MTVYLSPLAGAGWQFSDNNGEPLTGGKLHTYLAGTSTPAATYTSIGGGTPNTNPVVLDAAGRTESEIWLTAGATYKFVLADSNDVVIGTYDNIAGINDFDASGTSIYSDLANTTDVTKGDALIGFRQSNASGALTGAVGRTVHQKFQETVSVRDFGAVGDGATDDTTAFTLAVAAVATSGAGLYVPAGTYKITNVIASTGHLNMFGDGESSILDFSGTTSSASGITVSGDLTQIEAISSASLYGSTVVFASAPSLVTGDVFVIYDRVDYSWNAARAYYRAGEWCQCRSVDGVNARLTNPLYDGYTAADVDVYRLESNTVSFRNLRVVGGSGIGGLIKVSLCDRPVFENVSGYNENYQVVEIDRCYRVAVDNCNLYNKGTTSDDYGLVISNCQNFRVTGGDFYGRRHAIAIGGGDAAGAVTNRNLRIIGATLSNDLLSGIASADFHGNVQDCYYQDCTIYNGASWSGMDVGYDNCTIYAMYGGMCIYSAEIKGGELYARNCTFITAGDPWTVSRGIIDVGGNSAAISSGTTKTVNLIVENCFVRAPGASSSTDFMIVANNSSLVDVNIKIDGLTAECSAMGSVLRTKVESGNAYSQAIIVDNISNFPSGTYLHVPQVIAGKSYGDKPQRMMRQSGVVDMTAASGTAYTIASPINYKYPYPRSPVSQATTGGETTFLYNGNRVVWGGIYQRTESYIRPLIESGDATNWTSTSTVTLNWTVGIEEV